MTWEGGDDYDDGSGDDIPMEFYFFDELIVRGIRGIDQKFGVDHDGYLYDAEYDYADTEDNSSNTSNTQSQGGESLSAVYVGPHACRGEFRA